MVKRVESDVPGLYLEWVRERKGHHDSGSTCRNKYEVDYQTDMGCEIDNEWPC